jgi:hypothetical protein
MLRSFYFGEQAKHARRVRSPGSIDREASAFHPKRTFPRSSVTAVYPRGCTRRSAFDPEPHFIAYRASRALGSEPRVQVAAADIGGLRGQ